MHYIYILHCITILHVLKRSWYKVKIIADIIPVEGVADYTIIKMIFTKVFGSIKGFWSCMRFSSKLYKTSVGAWQLSREWGWGRVGERASEWERERVRERERTNKTVAIFNLLKQTQGTESVLASAFWMGSELEGGHHGFGWCWREGGKKQPKRGWCGNGELSTQVSVVISNSCKASFKVTPQMSVIYE